MKRCVKPLGRTGSFVFQLFLYNSVSFWGFLPYKFSSCYSPVTPVGNAKVPLVL